MSDELVAEALIGEEAKKFKESDLGRCLLGMAMQEVDAAHLALEEVNAADDSKIRDLQMQARLGRKFEQWLDELITRGDNALAIWRQEKDGT